MFVCLFVLVVFVLVAFWVYVLVCVLLFVVVFVVWFVFCSFGLFFCDLFVFAGFVWVGVLSVCFLCVYCVWVSSVFALFWSPFSVVCVVVLFGVCVLLWGCVFSFCVL